MYKKLLISILALFNLSVSAQTKRITTNQPLITATQELAWALQYAPQNTKARLASVIMQRNLSGMADALMYLETIASDLNSRSKVFQALYDVTQGSSEFLFTNLKSLGLTAVNARTITNYVMDNYSGRSKEPILTKEQQLAKDLAETKKRKEELLSEYKKVNEGIISGKIPLKEYDISLNKDNEVYGLPKTLNYNDPNYKIDEQGLLNLLDSVNIRSNFFVKFDSKGEFKSLYNETHDLINLNADIFDQLKKCISLTSPVTLNYNQKKYPVEFETKQFSIYPDQVTDYKIFAFTPNKNTISFIGTSTIYPIIAADTKFHLTDKRFLPDDMIGSQENTDYVKQLIYSIISKINYENTYGYENMVTSAQRSFYRYHFKLKKGQLSFNEQGVKYIVTTKMTVNKYSLNRFNNGIKQQLATKRQALKETVEVDKIYFYNGISKELERLHL